MSQSRFYIQLVLLSIVVAVALYFVHRLPALADHAALSWISLAFFILISLLLHRAGLMAATSSNKHNFTNVVMGFTIGKMMLSVFIIFAYLKLAEPETKLFILPFFGIYLLYTIFETYFMIRLGKIDTNEQS